MRLQQTFRSSELRVALWIVLTAAIAVMAGTAMAQAPAPAATSGWCGTQEMWDAKPEAAALRRAGACDIGPCDDSTTRDSWIPAPTKTLTFFKVYFNVFRENDGSNAAGTVTDVANAMASMNSQYLPYRIQFEYDMRFVNSSSYRYITNAAQFDAMKAAYAVRPDSQCNIYVVSVNVAGKVYSFATFPWDPAALTAYGGIVMNRTQFAPYDFGTMTHEMGHCLGLWHTHHGVSEVEQCGVCYESAGSPNNHSGDFCADTDPTPTNFYCSGPGGSDPCNGFPWGPTDPQNYMGYAPSTCYTEFSPQQSGRMSCWTNAKLQAWMSGVRFVSDTTFGQAPLAVAFQGTSAQQVTSWHWDFHDGATSVLQNPSHSFGPGNFDVTVAIESAGGPYANTKTGFIWSYADTFKVANALANRAKTVRVDISAHNYLPLTRMLVPFTWAGTFTLGLDSVKNTGTRTDGWALNLAQNDDLNKRRAYEINFAAVGGPGLFLPPGDGPVMSLYFRTPNTVPQGSSTPIQVISYGFQSPTFEALPGTYPGGAVAGSIIICLAGDVTNDGIGPDISDLTYLVSYLYLGGPPPEVIPKANCDGYPGTDIGDVVALVAYMYLGGPLLTCGL